MPVVQWLKNVFETKKKISVQERELKEINEQLIFCKSEALSLGVEFELALMDKATLKPAHRGVEIITEANEPTFHKESYEHMVEITTTVCRDAHDVEDQMGRNIQTLIGLADKRGLVVTGSGRPPTIKLAECHRIRDPRYDYLREGRKILDQRLARWVHISISAWKVRKNAFATIIFTCISCRTSSRWRPVRHSRMASIPGLHPFGRRSRNPCRSPVCPTAFVTGRNM